MKLSTASLLLLPTLAAAGKTIRGKDAAAKLMRSARRLDQNNQNNNGQGDDAQNDYEFLSKYNMKLIGCKTGEQIVDQEDGSYEYTAALFRLCPTENGCDSEAIQGCDEGYGDFVVGLNTFVDAYFEDQRDNMNWDDNFQVDRYAECAEYEMENDDDSVQYYIGPTCTEDELDVRLAVFDDYTCTTESETTFESISNGWSLPYEEGGIVSTSCIDCMEYDDDQGAYQLREMCTNLYMDVAYACEESMEYFSYYGRDVQGCDYVEEVTPASIKRASMKGGKIFGWIIFAVLIVGFAGYIVWWRKRKQSTSSSSDGLVA